MFSRNEKEKKKKKKRKRTSNSRDKWPLAKILHQTMEDLSHGGEEKSYKSYFVLFFLSFPNLAKSFPPLSQNELLPTASQTPLGLPIVCTSQGEGAGHCTWAQPYSPVAQVPSSPREGLATVRSAVMHPRPCKAKWPTFHTLLPKLQKHEEAQYAISRCLKILLL